MTAPRTRVRTSRPAQAASKPAEPMLLDPSRCTCHAPTLIRRLLVVSAAALVAGTAAILALTAAKDAWNSQGAAVIVALVAFWLGQGIAPLIRNHRRPR